MSRILEKIYELRSKLKFDDFIFLEDDGSILGFDEEGIVSYLLDEDVLFCNSIELNEKKYGKKDETIVLFVLCSDIWMWACADAEPIGYDKLPELCEMYMEDKCWGVTKWACKKRNMRPQKPIREGMKRDGVWDEEMDNLKPNYDEKEKS